MLGIEIDSIDLWAYVYAFNVNFMHIMHSMVEYIYIYIYY